MELGNLVSKNIPEANNPKFESSTRGMPYTKYLTLQYTFSGKRGTIKKSTSISELHVPQYLQDLMGEGTLPKDAIEDIAFRAKISEEKVIALFRKQFYCTPEQMYEQL